MGGVRPCHLVNLVQMIALAEKLIDVTAYAIGGSKGCKKKACANMTKKEIRENVQQRKKKKKKVKMLKDYKTKGRESHLARGSARTRASKKKKIVSKNQEPLRQQKPLLT